LRRPEVLPCNTVKPGRRGSENPNQDRSSQRGTRIVRSVTNPTTPILQSSPSDGKWCEIRLTGHGPCPLRCPSWTPSVSASPLVLEVPCLMRRKSSLAARFLGVSLLIVGASVGGVAALTGLNPLSLFHLAAAGGAPAMSGGRQSLSKPAPRPLP